MSELSIEQLKVQLAQEREARERAEQQLIAERKESQRIIADLEQGNEALEEITEMQTGELVDLANYEMQSPHPVVRISMAGELIAQNNPAKSLKTFQFEGKEIGHIAFWEKIALRLTTEVPELVLEAMSNGLMYSFTARRIEIGGYVVVFGSDISKQKKASNRLSKLIENLQAAVLLEDETRHIVLTNKKFCEMFSIPLAPDDMKGFDCSNSAEDAKVMFKNPEEFITRIDELLAKQELAIGDMLELHDGRYFERDYVPIFVDTQYSGHLWKYRDVTISITAKENLRRSEEKYRSIIEDVNMGLVEVDLEGKIRYANHSFCKMSGYQLEQLEGNSPSEILASGEDSALSHNHYIDNKGGKRSEVTVKDHNGKLRWWIFSADALYNDLNEHIGSICLHVDITNRKKLERDLEKAIKTAEDSVKAREQFLANMSHEIRTPMNAILGMSRHLKKTDLNEDQSIYLNTIHRASQNLLVIINDILDLSKVDAGKLQIEKINFNLHTVVNETLMVFAEKAEAKKLKLSAEINDEISNNLIGDPHRINQVLLNLMGNAIKFTEQGGISVRCTVKSQTSEAQRILIEVKDTGIGMSQDFLLSLFDKFSQEDDTIARKYGGSGLGMNISQKLIKLMGGSIKVMSRKNDGTTVSFELEMPFGSEEIEASALADSNAKLLKGQRILLAEDDEFNRLVAKLSLEDHGVIVTEVHNGEQAIEALQADTYDIVLMDMNMPVMDGLDATRILRTKLFFRIPIIALTASALKGDRERCLKAGMDDFITKPFEEVELVNVISKWVNSEETVQE